MTLWQSVTALTLGKNGVSQIPRSFRDKAGCPEDGLGASPNPINRTSFSIVKTLALEQPDGVRVFYRAPRERGPWRYLCSQDEGDRVVVRRFDMTVHLARTRP